MIGYCFTLTLAVAGEGGVEKSSRLILKDKTGRTEQRKKCSWNQSKMCLDSLIFCTLGKPFVICARRSSLEGGGERAGEEKSLQIINNNSDFAIDSFTWDFPREPISSHCWGGFGINFGANAHLCYIHL